MSIESHTPEIKLKRVLSLGDLIIYGIILIQPVAALPLFGHAESLFERSCSYYDPDCHGGHDIYSHKLREDGQPLSLSRFCLHLCRQRNQPIPGLCGRLVDVHGLYVHSHPLYHLYQHCGQSPNAFHPLSFWIFVFTSRVYDF